MSFTTTAPPSASAAPTVAPGAGRETPGRTAPAITYGHCKAHRPDLKQLLFILTMSADGNIPVAFRCSDGNMSDLRTHIETWNTLRAVAGRVQAVFAREHGSNRSRRWPLVTVL